MAYEIIPTWLGRFFFHPLYENNQPQGEMEPWKLMNITDFLRGAPDTKYKQLPHIFGASSGAPTNGPKEMGIFGTWRFLSPPIR